MATVVAGLLIVAPVLVGCSKTFPDGSTYIGAFKNGLPNGHGIIWYTDGDTYTGGWKGGKPAP